MDSQLLRRFRDGDRSALEHIYRRHVGEVERAVRRGLTALLALSAANLADLVQEVFLKAFSAPARASYDGLREYAPYLLTIARNVVVDWARRAGREVPTPDVLDAMEPVDAGGDGSPFAPALVSLVSTYLQALPPDLRAIHHRRFELAESQRDAAKALGISRQNLRTREQKLIDGLRRELRRAGVGSSPVAFNDVEPARATHVANARRT